MTFCQSLYRQLWNRFRRRLYLLFQRKLMKFFLPMLSSNSHLHHPSNAEWVASNANSRWRSTAIPLCDLIRLKTASLYSLVASYERCSTSSPAKSVRTEWVCRDYWRTSFAITSNYIQKISSIGKGCNQWLVCLPNCLLACDISPQSRDNEKVSIHTMKDYKNLFTTSYFHSIKNNSNGISFWGTQNWLTFCLWGSKFMFWADQNHLLPLPKVAEEDIPLVYQVNNVYIIF